MKLRLFVFMSANVHSLSSTRHLLFFPQTRLYPPEKALPDDGKCSSVPYIYIKGEREKRLRREIEETNSDTVLYVLLSMRDCDH